MRKKPTVTKKTATASTNDVALLRTVGITSLYLLKKNAEQSKIDKETSTLLNTKA